jgi:peroxiredoxin
MSTFASRLTELSHKPKQRNNQINNYMKRIMLFICAACAVLSASASVKYSLTGKVPATMNGQKVYLSIISKQTRTPQDSAVVANGTFKFVGTVNSADVAIGYFKAKAKISSFKAVLGEGPVTVDLTGDKAVLKGGPLNKALQDYDESMGAVKKKPVYANLNELITEYRDAKTTADRKKEIENLYDKYDNECGVIFKQQLEKNLNNVVGGFLFAVYGQNYLEEKEMSSYLDKAGKNFKDYPLVQSMTAQINAAKLRSIGHKYTDFEMADVNGKMHHLSEYIGAGKYTMVDFWASWCGPCRAEMPNVKAAYEKFHSKGFEIVGISLDQKKEAWTKAIADLGITWAQLSDLQGWKNAGAQKYGVNAIPCTLLIGPDGTIIASNLRGDALSNKLAELLK